jgi:hypothetical protein
MLSAMNRLNGILLLIAAAGIVLQIIVGMPGYPVVPPGPIILATAGILMLTLAEKIKWMVFTGIVAPAFILVGGLIEGSIWDRLGNIGDFGPFLGTALQMIGVAIALICGLISATQTYSRPIRT